MIRGFIAVIALVCLAAPVRALGEEPARITVRSEARAKICPLIFGQIFERAWAGAEVGAEAAWDPARKTWQEGFVDLVEELAPTNLRWPGGWRADRHDWRNGIDRVPGREGGRPLLPRGNESPITNCIGTDEVIALCRKVGAEPIFVVNFGDFIRGGNMADGVSLAADWVEYCNAPDDGTNPRSGVDWAAVRAANGHPEPFDVKYWQLANEVWVMAEQIKTLKYEFYAEWCVQYIAAMREVDPDIILIADGQNDRLRAIVSNTCGGDLSYLAVHSYAPWGMKDRSLSDAQAWLYYMSCPLDSSVREHFGKAVQWARDGERPVRLAVTEWNWNGGWWSHDTAEHPVLTNFETGLGAAVMLHDILRHADVVDIACVSLLAGTSWGISTIRCDPAAKKRCFRFPSFHVLKMYRHNTGDRLLTVETSGVPTYDLDRPFARFQPAKGLPYLDVVSSRDDKTLYLAVINRHFSDNLAATIDVEGLRIEKNADVRKVVLTAPYDAENTFDNPDTVKTVETCFKAPALPFEYTFPARSATILCLPLETALSGRL